MIENASTLKREYFPFESLDLPPIPFAKSLG